MMTKRGITRNLVDHATIEDIHRRFVGEEKTTREQRRESDDLVEVLSLPHCNQQRRFFILPLSNQHNCFLAPLSISQGFLYWWTHRNVTRVARAQVHGERHGSREREEECGGQGLRIKSAETMRDCLP